MRSLRKFNQSNTIKTLGTGEDVSNCVAFLASDMANYINGENTC